ncbi:hypothetical protein Zm00014a_032602 [Zea mays]|uniref:Uncharacterized protein n=1 Tax=Zea mays TaxID=4577 RepID=A0A3L6E5W8_MAIZE|nr:hypothetical protein Zm00014a_032602 [Zea mays]
MKFLHRFVTTPLKMSSSESPACASSSCGRIYMLLTPLQHPGVCS